MQTLADAALDREYREHLLSMAPKDGLLKVEVWSADESTLLLTIDDLTPVDQTGQFIPTAGTARSCNIVGDGQADIQLTAQLVVDNADGSLSRPETDPASWAFAEGNVLKVWTGYRLPSGGNALFPRFWGYIGQATVFLDAATGDAAVSVPAAGVEQRLLDSKFNDTTKYSDTVTESANYAAPAQGASASATSELQVGDALQVGAKVYQSQAYATVLGVRKAVKGNIAAKTISPAFIRASVAYLDDGTQVASGVPRYQAGAPGFGQALRAAEGTTNLLTANQSSVETDTTGFTARNSATMTRDTVEHWHGTASLKCVTPGTVAAEGFYIGTIPCTGTTPYAGTVHLKGSGTVRVYLFGNVTGELAGAVTASLSSSWTKIQVTGTTGASDVALSLWVVTNSVQAVTYYCDGNQIEQKAYATSWQLPSDGARAAESLTIPTAGVLNAAEGSLEVIVAPDHSSAVSPGGGFDGFYDFTWGTPGTTGFMLVRKHTAGNPSTIRLEYWNAGTIRIDYTAAYNAGDRIRLGVRWSSAGAAFLVNGALIGSNAAPLVVPSETIAYIGQRPAFGYGNALYDDLLASSRARTDAESLANYQSGQPLPWDEDTTLKLDFDGALAVGPTSNIVDGSTTNAGVVQYAETGLTKLELVSRIDLGAIVTVNSLTPSLGPGTACTTLRTSTTGFEPWTNQPTSGITTPTSIRYIELTVEAQALNAAASVTINEVAALAGATFPTSQAIDTDQLTFWRPRASDLDRTLTLAFGQVRTFNAIYLQWGTNPVDTENPVAYKIFNGDTGALLVTQAARVAGLVEHVILGGVTCSSLIIQVIQASGVVALRNIEVLNVTAVNTVTFLLGDMATQAGLTRQRISNSKLYRANLTARIGEDYHGRMKEITDAIGWRLYGAADGYLVAEPHLIDPTTPVASYVYGDANFIGSFNVEAATLGAKNHIVVLAKLPTATIRGERKDDAAGSPTSVQRLGDRVEVIEDRLADTQKKADLRALVALLEKTKWRAPRTFEHVANPAHDIWDVLRLEEPVTKTSGNFILVGFTMQITPQAFRMQYRVAPA